MHTSSGAYRESLFKHVHPSKIIGIKSGEIKILDIGFGLGYNILAAVNEIRKTCSETNIRITSFEKNNDLHSTIDKIKFNDGRDIIYSKIRSAYEIGFCESENLHISVMKKDARESIKSINDIEFNAVFHDPFSPGKNPELWTVEFFSEVYRVMKRSAILTTYSSAPQIRSALLIAGFFVGRGPGMGKKREGTLASRTAAFNPLTDLENSEILSDARSSPYHDYSGMDRTEIILGRRIEEMGIRRIKEHHQAHQV